MKYTTKKLWLISILLSFAYDMPLLFFSSMDRSNPRLFDVLFLIGLFLFNNELHKSIDNIIYLTWKKMIFWMTFCCLLYTIIEQNSVIAYSYYYLFKYVEGLLVIKMVLLCKKYINVDFLEKIFIVSGVFITLYSIPQYLSLERTYYELSPGKIVSIDPGTIVGPYTGSYFSIAQIVPICSLFCINRLFRAKQIKEYVLLFSLFVIISFPAFNSGSRTALVFFLFSIIVYMVISQKSKYIILLFVTVLSVLFICSVRNNMSFSDYLLDNSSTMARQKTLEEDSDQTIEDRILWFAKYDIESYDNGSLTPFVGSGFYISPVNGHYRIGYGYHNNYIFAFEQLGIVGFYLFIMLFVRTLKGSKQYFKSNGIALIGYSYFFTFLFINMSGQSFWHGFGTINMNTLVMLLMTLSVEPIINYKNENPSRIC